MFDTVQSEYLVEYLDLANQFAKFYPPSIKCLLQLRSKQCRICQTFTWQKFVMGNLPKFYTAKQCSIRYQIMKIYQPPPQFVENMFFIKLGVL